MTTEPSCFLTRLNVRTRPRPGRLALRRLSTTSHSTWIVSPTKVGPFTSSSMCRNANPVCCIVACTSRPSAKEYTIAPGTTRCVISLSVRRNSVLENSTNTEFLRTESDITQRVVPGAMVYSFAEGLLVHATMQHTGFAFLHMELDVKGPTFVGDTIHVECEVVESRRSASRPGRGLVRTFNRVKKQDGSVVITYNPLRMVKARE